VLHGALLAMRASLKCWNKQIRCVIKEPIMDITEPRI